MRQLSMERLVDLDRKHGEEIVVFLRNVRRENIEDDDNIAALCQIAERLGVPPEEFSALVRAKLYAKERGVSCEPTTSPVLMAKHIGVVLEEFFAWLEVQAEIFGQDRDALADELGAEVCDDHRRRRPELDSAEWQAYLDDLRDDARMQGD